MSATSREWGLKCKNEDEVQKSILVHPNVHIENLTFYKIANFPRCLSGKESACHCRRHKRCRFDPYVRNIPWSKKWQAIPVFLPGKFHGQRSLAGSSPKGHKESDMTKQVCTHAQLLQCLDRHSLLQSVLLTWRWVTHLLYGWGN